MTDLSTGPVASLARPFLLRFTPQVAVLLALGAAAWALTLSRWREMGSGPGTMGMSLPEFAGMWVPMMAAMMLPAVSPLASMYARSVRTHRPGRLVAFVAGYLAVWASTALPAYGLLRAAEGLVGGQRLWARVAAAGVFALAGVYQLSPLKDLCLRHCRSPLALLFHYGSFRGRTRDVRAALHHGAYCVGCCWALFALFLAFGAMHVGAMVAITAVVLVEKLSARGRAFSRVVGVACLAAAVAVLWLPDLAPGLLPDDRMAPSMDMMN